MKARQRDRWCRGPGQGRRFCGAALGLPALPLLVGLTELVSGRSFGELAEARDDLKGWQRGILGLVIVAIATTVSIVVVGTTISVRVE